MSQPDTKNPLIPTGAPKEEELTTEVSPLVASANALTIDSDAMFEVAGGELRDVAGMRKTLEERRLAITRPMDAAKKEVMDLFRAPLDRVQEAERIIRGKMTTYSAEQQRQRAEEARQREEAAQRERERMAQEAREAEEAGDIATAETLSVAAEAISAPAPARAAPKAAGISTSKRWSAEVVDKRAFIEHALKDEQYFDMVQIDMKPLNQMAVALKANMKVPGVKAVSTDSLSVR